MTLFDLGVVAILVISIAISLLRGLSREMVSLAVWVGGFILATYFGGYVAGLLPDKLQPLWSALIGWIINMALSSAVRASGLAPADRALGSLFGLVRGLLVVLVIVLLAGLTPLPRQPFWRDAFLSGPFETAALALRPHLPARMGQHLKYR